MDAPIRAWVAIFARYVLYLALALAISFEQILFLDDDDEHDHKDFSVYMAILIALRGELYDGRLSHVMLCD